MKHYTNDREGIVDVLKGICILLVCFTHYSWQSVERQKYLFPWWVDMAVPVFMILSGYVYGKSAQTKKMYSLTQAYASKTMIRKALRFSVPMLITYIAILVWDKKTYGEIPYDVVITFLQGGRGPGSYYYPVMMQTIFVLPIINAIVVKHEEKGLLICLALNAIYEVLHVAYLIPVESYRLLMFRYIFVLASGCYISLGKPIKAYIPVSMLCAGTLFLLAWLYTGYSPTYVIHWTGTSFIASMFIIPFVMVILRKCKIRIPILESVGKASYNIFLIQMLYYYTICKTIYQNIASRKLELLLSMAICICGGILFYLVETPLTKYIQKRTNELLFKNE